MIMLQGGIAMDTYSVKEIADMLNTNPETVRRWIRSGKLEAIQESRKGGNVVTKSMLDAFLKSSPKYAGIATGLLASPVGLTTATAAIVGGILAQQLIKVSAKYSCGFSDFLVSSIIVGERYLDYFITITEDRL